MKTTEDLALHAIGIVDYDIMKECQEQIEDEEDPDMVEEMSRFLSKTVNKAVKEATAALQARVRELEKKLGAADKMREAMDTVMVFSSCTPIRTMMDVCPHCVAHKAITAYDAARGK